LIAYSSADIPYSLAEKNEPAGCGAQSNKISLGIFRDA